MTYISLFSVPLMISLFVGMGLFRKVGVYDCFVEGAKDGLQSMVGIIPPLIGLMVAINMFRASGALELLSTILAPVLNLLKLPSDVLPLTLLRPISGSASTAIVTDIFQNLGPDSTAGKIASVMMGSTETTFYTVAVYFGAVGIKNSRHTLASALTADTVGILLSVLIANWLL